MSFFKELSSKLPVNLFLKTALALSVSNSVNAIGFLDGEPSVDESPNGICRALISFKNIDQENKEFLATTTGFLISPPLDRADLKHRLLIFPGHSLVADSSYEKNPLLLQQNKIMLHFTSTSLSTKIEKLIFHPNFGMKDDFVDQALVILSTPVKSEEETQLNYNPSSIKDEDYSAFKAHGHFTAWGPKSEKDGDVNNYKKRRVDANVFRDSEPYPSLFSGEEISYSPHRLFYTSGLKKQVEGKTHLPGEITEQMSEFYTLSGDSGGRMLVNDKVALLSVQDQIPLNKEGKHYDRKSEEALDPSLFPILFQTNVYQLIDTKWIQDALKQ